MIRVPYSQILAAVTDRIGWTEPASEDGGLNEEEFSAARRAINSALQEIHGATWWRDLMRTERRTLRDTWSVSTAYVAGDEVYHAGSDAYYQALRASTGQAPAAADGSNGWNVNLAYWAEVEYDPQADDYDAATSYAAGDKARNPDDGVVYQCHTASVGNDPTDAAFWGAVIPFVTYIPWVQSGKTGIGDVRSVTDVDPRLLGARPVMWEPAYDGVLLIDCPVTLPWVHFRIETPKLTGSPWESGSAYTPPDGDSSEPSAGSQSTAMIAMQGVAALRAKQVHLENQMEYLDYLLSADDGKGGWYIFKINSSETDDSIDYLKPDNVAAGDPGRWVRSENP